MTRDEWVTDPWDQQRRRSDRGDVHPLVLITVLLVVVGLAVWWGATK